MVPKLDERTRLDLQQQIDGLAKVYTPEWRYSQEQPDIGSVLANLFAGLMAETIHCYNQMPELARADFLDALGTRQLPPAPAGGYVVFKLARADMPDTVVPEKTGLLADLTGRDLQRYETQEDVFVSAAAVTGCHNAHDPVISLCFDRHPGAGVISLLLVLPGGERNPGGQTVWEYWDGQGWRVIRTEDGTGNLRHTGIIRFVALPDWQCTETNGRQEYRMRVVWNGSNPFAADELSVYHNAGKVIACEPGSKGNLPAGVTFDLVKTIGFVAAAFSPDLIYGGTDQEDTNRAIVRGCARNRHRFRAVTPGDFERLVYERCPEVQRVACYSGYDKQGERRAGAVTVVVVTADYPQTGRYFYTTAQILRDWLLEHCEGVMAPAGLLSVVAPTAVRVSVISEVAVRSYGEVLRIQNQLQNSLRTFLHPLTGNHHGHGWEFGEVVEYDNIRSHLLSQAGVVRLRHLRMAYEIETGQGFLEISEEQLRRTRFTLPEAGSCQVLVTVEGGI